MNSSETHQETGKEFPQELEHSPIFNGLEESARREMLSPLNEMVKRGLGVAKIEMLLRGGVSVTGLPPERIAHAVASVNYNNGQPRLTLYEGFFNEKNRGRDHIIRHELGHVMTDLIFDKSELQNIVAAARDADAATEDLSPYGQMLIDMARDPSSAALLEHRGEGSHLRRELKKLEALSSNNETEPSALAEARADMVREILADRIANFFECDGTAEGYGRLRFSNAEGEFTENDPRFDQEKALFETIKTGIANSDNWQIEPEAPDIFWDDDIYYEPEYAPLSQPVENPPQPSPASSSSSGGDPVAKFLRWLTGTRIRKR